MSQDCIIKSPLSHGGTSQRERVQRALDPSYVKVDERTTEELLAFASKLAEEINYFDLNNTVDGTWKEFVDGDLSTIVSLISIEDTSETVEKYQALHQEARDLVNAIPRDNNGPYDAQWNLVAAKVEELFSFILTEGLKINGWFVGTQRDSLLSNMIKGQIVNVLKRTRFNLKKYEEELTALVTATKNGTDETHSTDFYAPDLTKYDNWDSVWVYDPLETPNDPVGIFVNSGILADKILVGLDILMKEFEKFSRVQIIVKNEAPTTLEATLNEWPDHDPHMGLFLAFLQLFKHAQDEVNTMTSRHLDYYLKEVLRLTKKDKVSDKVHVIFELAKNVEGHLVKKGALVKAGVDNIGQDVFFELDQDTVVNQAKVKEIKSVYAKVDETSGATTRVFSAEGANTVKGEGKEDLEKGIFWNLFGKDQEGLFDDMRTMEDAKIGFALSSPILMLSEAQRDITVKLIVPASETQNPFLERLVQDNYAPSDFVYGTDVLLTGPEGWIETELFGVSLEKTASDEEVEIKFMIRLTSKDDSVVKFDASVHTDTFQTEWPVVKFIFTNEDISARPFDLPTFSYQHKYEQDGGPETKPHVMHFGTIYRLKDDTVVDGRSFSTRDWERITKVKDFAFTFKNNLDIQLFDRTANYEKGDIILFDGRHYVASGSVNYSEADNTPPSPIDPFNGEFWHVLEQPVYPYGLIRDLKFKTALIDVSVRGMSTLTLGNEFGSINENKPFYPFGSRPDIESVFYIGSKEIFSKKLYSLEFDINWEGLPETSLTEYYAAMESPTPIRVIEDDKGDDNPYNDDYKTTGLKYCTGITNSSFNASLEIKQPDGWATVIDRFPLFDTMSNGEVVEKENPGFVYHSPYSSASEFNNLFFDDKLPPDHGDPALNPPRVKRSVKIIDPSVTYFTAPTYTEGEDLQGSPNFVNPETEVKLGSIDRNTDLPDFDNYEHYLPGGFARMVFKKPFNTMSPWCPFETNPGRPNHLDKDDHTPSILRGMGHHEFQKTLTGRIINQAKEDNTQSGTFYAKEIPNEPLELKMKSIVANYKSNVTIDLTVDREDSFNERKEKFYHLQPFGGQNEVHRHIIDFKDLEYEQEIDNIDFLPQFDHEGYCYIGIENFKAPGTLSLLFQFANGTNNPDLRIPEIEWTFLENNVWKDFGYGAIVADSTNNFTTSGIITFDFPSTFNNDNTILKSGLHWLRGRVQDNLGALNASLVVSAQAAVATYVDKDNDPARLANVIAAETAKGLAKSQAEIIRLQQPFASFGGRMTEDDDNFYIRTSERMRHKDRAVNIKDYETMVLEEFPKIYRVKCLNHTRSRVGLFDEPNAVKVLKDLREQPEYLTKTQSVQRDMESIEKIKLLLGTEVEEGNVTLVLIPRAEDVNSIDVFEPRCSIGLLEEIKDFVQDQTSLWVNVDVENPLYEKIELHFDVFFKDGYDKHFYSKQLNEELLYYLTPWASENAGEIKFGGKILKSEIINFIDERPYVDYIHNFKMFQIIQVDGDTIVDRGVVDENNEPKGLEEAVARTSRSIISTVGQHFITPQDKPKQEHLGGVNYQMVEFSNDLK